MRLRILTLSILALSAGAVGSTAAYANMEDILTCTNISEDSARLACFDAAVPGVRAEIDTEDEEQRAEIAEERDQRSFFGLPRLSLPNVLRRNERTEEEFGEADMLERQARDEGTTDELVADLGMIQEVTVNVVEWGRNPYGKYFLVLENGHVWRQTDDGRMPLRNSGNNTVIISRTRFGGFMMKVNGNNRFYRVERLR